MNIGSRAIWQLALLSMEKQDKKRRYILSAYEIFFLRVNNLELL